MKKIIFSLLVISTVLLSTSCKKYKEFNVTSTSSFTIPSNNALINLPMEIVTPESTTNFQSQVETQGSSSKLIDHVTLTSFNLTITNPANANFNFLNSIEVYLSSPNQPEILLASQYDIPENNATQLMLNPSGEDLKEYVKESNLTIRTKAVTDKVINYDISIKTDEVFLVKVALKNIFKK